MHTHYLNGGAQSDGWCDTSWDISFAVEFQYYPPSLFASSCRSEAMIARDFVFISTTLYEIMWNEYTLWSVRWNNKRQDWSIMNLGGYSIPRLSKMIVFFENTPLLAMKLSSTPQTKMVEHLTCYNFQLSWSMNFFKNCLKKSSPTLFMLNVVYNI